jgi:hypothetical protein
MTIGSFLTISLKSRVVSRTTALSAAARSAVVIDLQAS